MLKLKLLPGDSHDLIAIEADGTISGWHALLFSLGLSPCLMPRHACATCPASAYATIQTEYRDESALIAALDDLGYKPAVHKSPVSLTGYKGDVRTEQAHIVVPRAQIGASSNDVGFERLASGSYTARISEYDGRSTFTPSIQLKLKVRYNYHATLGALKRKGYTVSESVSDGKVKLTARRA